MSKISPDTLRFLRQAASRWKADALNLHRYGADHFSVSKSRSVVSHQTRLASSSSQAAKEESSYSKAPGSHYGLFPKSIPKGPPPSGPFAVDMAELKREFLQLQATAHPDRHPPERRNAAAAVSARINDAYRTLSDPLKRAQYLLSFRGMKGGEDDEGTLGDEPGDTDMLMEVMEAREAAEEAQEEDKIWTLRQENTKRIEEVIERMADAFERDDLETARKDCIRLRYWVGVEDRLREGTSMH